MRGRTRSGFGYVFLVIVGLAITAARILQRSIPVDIKVNEKQGKDEKYRNRNADCDSDPGGMGDTMGRSAAGAQVREIGWGLVCEYIGRF